MNVFIRVILAALAGTWILSGCVTTGNRALDSVLNDFGNSAIRSAGAPSGSTMARQGTITGAHHVSARTATLDAFPYIAIPPGYTNRSRREDLKTLARFPFWVRDHSQWLEGQFLGTSFTPEPGRSMSMYEVRQYFSSMVRQLGGTQVSEGKIAANEIYHWGREITQGFIAGLGDIYNSPATTYRVPRGNSEIWVHLVVNSAQGWYIVGEGVPVPPPSN